MEHNRIKEAATETYRLTVEQKEAFQEVFIKVLTAAVRQVPQVASADFHPDCDHIEVVDTNGHHHFIQWRFYVPEPPKITMGVLNSKTGQIIAIGGPGELLGILVKHGLL